MRYPLEYVNAPEVMGKLDKLISINSCISCDLYGQVCAESFGTRQISGTGGQLDFLTGAAMSKGGKAFLCTASTFTEKDGTVESSIVPTFNRVVNITEKPGILHGDGIRRSQPGGKKHMGESRAADIHSPP